MDLQKKGVFRVPQSEALSRVIHTPAKPQSLPMIAAPVSVAATLTHTNTCTVGTMQSRQASDGDGKENKRVMDKDSPDVAAECLPSPRTPALALGPWPMRTPLHSDTLAQTDVAAVWGLLRRQHRGRTYREGLLRPGKGETAVLEEKIGSRGGAGLQAARATGADTRGYQGARKLPRQDEGWLTIPAPRPGKRSGKGWR